MKNINSNSIYLLIIPFLFLLSARTPSTHSLPLKPPSTILTPTTTPPLLNVPTYSLATTTTTNTNDNDEKSTNPSTTTMNILTYATPIGIKPYRTWAISLYKETLSYQNFCKNGGVGILQLLTKKHVPLVRYLGGVSGRNVNKEDICHELGFTWCSPILQKGEGGDGEKKEVMLPKVLPHCKSYLLLTQEGELIDVGSHAVAICRVEQMFVGETTEEKEHEDEGESAVLSTAYLRKLGLITNLGRVADPPSFGDDNDDK